MNRKKQNGIHRIAYNTNQQLSLQRGPRSWSTLNRIIFSSSASRFVGCRAVKFRRALKCSKSPPPQREAGQWKQCIRSIFYFFLATLREPTKALALALVLALALALPSAVFAWGLATALGLFPLAGSALIPCAARKSGSCRYPRAKNLSTWKMK